MKSWFRGPGPGEKPRVCRRESSPEEYHKLALQCLETPVRLDSLTGVSSLHLDAGDAKIAGGLVPQTTLGAGKFQWNKSAKHIARLCLDCWKV